ncbi:MFS transporter [Amycolatopsis sp. FDAARGOS 1241]|uniref:MFS transporter n=1 Tax=Amycolatopsis sp. FDAARGOS 1241 TaxID=2778070 RepID=UPI001951E184|nr:MFS transporter [Amycolatopsis sp. FDAARGOS 1241]QRP48534.1 MFS transporter [Amycolatopsis sp. FDAARGOS 1241]
MTAAVQAPSSTWAPLRRQAFRALWIAQLGSNIGSWMQSVGAQWTVVHQPEAATLTSIVQAASLIPVLFVSLPAGVLADVLDRRRLIGVLTAVMVVITAILAVLSARQLVPPATLITITLLLGACQALMSPAWQAIQPELVPRAELPSAAALGSLNVNIARAIGPALAGFVLALTGPAVVFGVNAVSDVLILVAVLRWRRKPAESAGPGEPLLPALRAGIRYVRYAPGVRRILLRALVFVLPASALWGLLPVVAAAQLGLGSGGYGVLLGALGLGAVGGAVVMRPLRARLGRNTMLAAATLAYAVGVFAAALLPNAVAVALLLVLGGTGWLIGLSTLNTTLQLALPGWVRARALAVYLMIFLGGQGVGALIWGLVAAGLGAAATLTISAVLLVLGAVSLVVLPIHPRTGELDRTVVMPWPEPEIGILADGEAQLDPAAGPVLVEVSYHVPPENAAEFLKVLARVGVSRQRTGARRWSAYRDLAAPDRYCEVFEVGTWAEHLRQHHERITGVDAGLYRKAAGFALEPPENRHLLATGR